MQLSLTLCLPLASSWVIVIYEICQIVHKKLNFINVYLCNLAHFPNPKVKKENYNLKKIIILLRKKLHPNNSRKEPNFTCYQNLSASWHTFQIQP